MSDSNHVPRFDSRSFILVISLALSLMVAGSSAAQSRGTDSKLNDASWTGSETVQKSADPSWKTNAFSNFEFQGKTGVDGGGDYKYWMVAGGAGTARMIGEDVKIALKGDYRAIGYDFGGIGAGTDPWETVHVLRLNPLLTYLINDTWSVIGGPIIEFTGEEQAQFDDSLRGGGLFGFGYTRERLHLAFGVIAMTEIEKDARILPFILVNWNITDALAFGVKADTSRGGELRLDYAFTKKFKLGAGFGVRRELFRLNGDGPQACAGNSFCRQDGVGEENASVAKLVATFQVTPKLAIEGYGGVVANGEFRLESQAGNKIAQADYDNSGFGGVTLRYNF